MQAKIKSLHLENFKGVKSATYQFNGKNVSAIGQNGAGKTTIFTAYMWLMVDKDSDLKSNPNIRPLDTEECTPRVEVVFDIDGKEVVAEKFQKMKKKEYEKNGQKVTEISTENSYKVNHSSMGLAQFKKKMATYGFDFEKFLQLSHTDAFTNQMATKKDLEKMRDTLFEMAESYTDLQIAEMMGNVPEVAELLNVNAKDEIRATQNDALRDIRENYGKDGEILRAKIEGMEQSKTDIDVAELELQKKALNEQITENKAKQGDISKEFEERQRASDGIIERKFELNDLQRKANEELVKQKKELQSQIDEKNEYLFNIGMSIQKSNRKIAGYEQDIEEWEKYRKKLLEQWNTANAEEFDEQTEFCPACGRRLPDDEIENVRKEFVKNKRYRITAIEKKGGETKQDIENAKEMIKKLQECNKDNFANKEKLEKEVADLEKKLSELPESIDISDRPKVQEIQRQIAEKEAAMNKGNSAEETRQDLRFELNDLQNHLVEVEKQLSLAQHNIEIDEQIAALRKKQSKFEQNKANAERILYQLDLVSRKKNTLLQDDVNSHFKLVKFRLFDYLKNGSVVDDCEPTIDGKSLKDHSNGALRVLAKLDIVEGLQRFYGQRYPVFAEDFSLVTDNTECRIDMECQLIKLVAEKGVKELKIEVED